MKKWKNTFQKTFFCFVARHLCSAKCDRSIGGQGQGNRKTIGIIPTEAALAQKLEKTRVPASEEVWRHSKFKHKKNSSTYKHRKRGEHLKKRRHSFFNRKNSSAAPPWGTCLRTHHWGWEEKKPNTRQESNPQPPCYEACGLTQRYKCCPKYNSPL